MDKATKIQNGKRVVELASVILANLTLSELALVTKTRWQFVFDVMSILGLTREDVYFEGYEDQTDLDDPDITDELFPPYKYTR